MAKKEAKKRDKDLLANLSGAAITIFKKEAEKIEISLKAIEDKLANHEND